MKLAFLNRFYKRIQVTNFMKIRQFGAKLFHAGRRTDITKKIVAFRSFAIAPKNSDYFPLRIIRVFDLFL
jgi:hypothetical protein